MLTLRRAAAMMAWLSCVLAMPASAAGPLSVIYPRSSSSADQRSDYYITLLDLALSKSGAPYQLRPHDTPMVELRVLQKLSTNDGINVTWMPTSRAYEQQLLPIRIPLDKGLLGWRIFLIRQRDRAQFAAIQTLQQLQACSAGQVSEWIDTGILRANGMKVIDAPLYDGLFPMLNAGRFQYFPRGIAEIWGELNSHAGLGLEVEPHLALHYPAYTYFFVAKNNPELARLIERGLRAAIADGSFDRLFERYNGDLIKRARLSSRLVFELKNPYAPESAPALPDLSDGGAAAHRP